LRDVVYPRDAIGDNVVCGLDIEGLFDFSVRSDEEMEDDECGNERVEEDIWKMC
jgi:hypothetical protein